MSKLCHVAREEVDFYAANHSINYANGRAVTPFNPVSCAQVHLWRLIVVKLLILRWHKPWDEKLKLQHFVVFVIIRGECLPLTQCTAQWESSWLTGQTVAQSNNGAERWIFMFQIFIIYLFTCNVSVPVFGSTSPVFETRFKPVYPSKRAKWAFIYQENLMLGQTTPLCSACLPGQIQMGSETTHSYAHTLRNKMYIRCCEFLTTTDFAVFLLTIYIKKSLSAFFLMLH